MYDAIGNFSAGDYEDWGNGASGYHFIEGGGQLVCFSETAEWAIIVHSFSFLSEACWTALWVDYYHYYLSTGIKSSDVRISIVPPIAMFRLWRIDFGSTLIALLREEMETRCRGVPLITFGDRKRAHVQGAKYLTQSWPQYCWYASWNASAHADYYDFFPSIMFGSRTCIKLNWHNKTWSS